MGMNVKRDILLFSSVAFILLSILFGMNIMTFIFGSLNTANTAFANGSIGQNTSVAVQTNSLSAINTYASGANNQFSILSISIVLVLLLGVFALFYKNVIGGSRGEGGFGG